VAGSVREVSAYRGASDWDAGVASGAPPDPDVTVRQERDAAHARLQAHAAGGPCQDFESPDHDFDSCVNAVVQRPVLFQKQADDVDAIDSRDVNQGELSDCNLLAPLAAMAGMPVGRDFLRNAIVENKNSKGGVVSYTVTLHASQERPGMVTFRKVAVTVDGPYVVGHASARASGSEREVWPLVMEKACAKYLGGYNKLGRPGDPSVAMKLLTGRNATSTSFDWPRRWFAPYSEATLKADVANGKLVVLTTKTDLDGAARPAAGGSGSPALRPAYGLTPGHAYFVKGVEQHAGKTFVALGNPWHDADPELVPFDELTDWFAGVSRGSLP
jgi:Calpain family cysteine protease